MHAYIILLYNVDHLYSGVGRYSSKGVHHYQIARVARAKISTTPTFDRKLRPFCINEVADWFLSEETNG